MSTSEPNPLTAIAELLEAVGLGYAVIGGHAVNVWLEPRFTADIDLTVSANPSELSRLRDVFSRAGYTPLREHGDNLPSGPDFVRWASPGGDVVEVQIAKTALQTELIRRAVRSDSGARIATREDLIVLKLIADRAKDRVDLEGLCALEGIDWSYVDRWAREWDVLDRLARFRG